MKEMIDKKKLLEEFEKIVDLRVNMYGEERENISFSYADIKNVINGQLVKDKNGEMKMESINVLRKQEIETNAPMIGDQIQVTLDKLGTFTATAHKITDKGILFLFDEYVANQPMNKTNTNEGGYEKSDLKKRIDTKLIELFPSDLKGRITDLSIPTMGELFGHEDEWDEERVEPDEDEQLPLMKEPKNRVAWSVGSPDWGWLRNATKKEVSSADFVVINPQGDTAYDEADGAFGVRPEFWLVK